MRALGVDVSVARGLDFVVLDSKKRVVATLARASLDDLNRWLQEFEPLVIAIDSPPAFGARSAERELARIGISAYAVPKDDMSARKPFYDWMREGHRVFATARDCGYDLYRSGDPAHSAMETFPHATAVVLNGMLPRTSKLEFRKAALKTSGVDTNSLKTQDQIDAALCALTGIMALEGAFHAAGIPSEGVIVLPGALQARRIGRVN
ncbi:MAG: DUF429 domain-containing protein [Actinomycetota bacterium]